MARARRVVGRMRVRRIGTVIALLRIAMVMIVDDVGLFWSAWYRGGLACGDELVEQFEELRYLRREKICESRERSFK